MSEIPVRSALRRLVDWINPTGAKKVHSFIDTGYLIQLIPLFASRKRESS